MYLVGTAHPNKTDSQLTLQRLVAAKERLVCDAEVLQEIVHRYVSIERRAAISLAIRALLGVVDEVFPIEKEDVLRAAAIVAGRERQSARDLNAFGSGLNERLKWLVFTRPEPPRLLQ